MKHTHRFTIMAASVVLFAVVLMSGLALATNNVSFDNPLWRFKQASDVVEIQQVKVEPELASNMKLVFSVGKEVGEPETLEAILLQETDGGRSSMIGNKESPVGKRSYGLMQVQVIAARDVFERHPDIFVRYFPKHKYRSISDEEIIALLLTDKEANARIAAYNFRDDLEQANGDVNKALVGYNAGFKIANRIKHHDQFDYVIGVRSKLNKIVKPFNQQHGLQLTERFS